GDRQGQGGRGTRVLRGVRARPASPRTRREPLARGPARPLPFEAAGPPWPAGGSRAARPARVPARGLRTHLPSVTGGIDHRRCAGPPCQLTPRLTPRPLMSTHPDSLVLVANHEPAVLGLLTTVLTAAGYRVAAVRGPDR